MRPHSPNSSDDSPPFALSPSSPQEQTMDFIKTSNKRSEREGEGEWEESLVTHIRDDLSPFNDVSPPTIAVKRNLLKLIGEYLRDDITLKRFLTELSVLTSPISAIPGDIYRWLVQLLAYSDKDPSHKLVSFMLENGVDRMDLEYVSSHSPSMCSDAEKKPVRVRIRKSTSKGIRCSPNKWTQEESERLIALVNDQGEQSWRTIAERVGGGKTGAQCAQHWKRVLCPVIRKGSWDDIEEMQLLKLVEKHGQSWKNVAADMGNRTDIQCRYQYFKATMSREVKWSPEEDSLLQQKKSTVRCENPQILWVEVARKLARGKLTKIPRTSLECRERYEVLTNPNVDLKTLSSSLALPKEIPLSVSAAIPLPVNFSCGDDFSSMLSFDSSNLANSGEISWLASASVQG